MNTIHLKADFKQIIREPVLVLFMLIPLFIYVVFKLMIMFLFPLVLELISFDLMEYRAYLLAFVFLMAPGMLGTVIGFLMIDDRDEKIYQLMSVTPLGRFGYILNRLYIPFWGGIIYTLIGYYSLDVFRISFIMLLYLAVLSGLQGIMIGLMLFCLAKDKVQGLTYSKGFGIFYLFSMVDLLKIRWVSIIAAFTPFYWISGLIINPGTPSILMSGAVHVLWLVSILYYCKKLR